MMDGLIISANTSDMHTVRTQRFFNHKTERMEGDGQGKVISALKVLLWCRKLTW